MITLADEAAKEVLGAEKTKIAQGKIDAEAEELKKKEAAKNDPWDTSKTSKNLIGSYRGPTSSSATLSTPIGTQANLGVGLFANKMPNRYVSGDYDQVKRFVGPDGFDPTKRLGIG
jgi:hypothetical protein